MRKISFIFAIILCGINFSYADKLFTGTSWPALSSGIFTQIPAIVQGYSTDTAGRTNGISDPSGTRAISYIKGRPATVTYTAGPLKGYQIIRSRDTNGRDTGFTLKRDGAIIHSATKAPNGSSDQIAALASGNVKIIPQRDASQHITGYQWGNTNGTFAITAEQTWTRGLDGRIEFATNNITGAPTFKYLLDPEHPEDSFDPKNRRLKCQTAGGTWIYDYDNHGQLISAVHDTLLTAHSTLATFSYSFDGIGRRTGNNFTSNVLNQPTTWVNNQNKTLHIVAHPDARVWYNGTEIPEFTGIYNATIPIPGANGGWVPWNTLAIREGQGEGTGTPPISPYANPDAKAEKSGAVWVPPAIENIDYDAAGNRQSNAQWHYGWDAKNQLARARTKNLTTAPFGYDISYLYDAEGRRIQKQVTQYKNGSPVSEKIITFIWDGWDLIYERHQLPSGLTTLERSYLWGPDIANGSAGGAGGLLLIRQKQGNQTKDLYPLYDGTGHVIALTDSNKTLQAQYAYGPFGEKISSTGPQANGNPWRYATKYLDEETGLYYFGKRYYDPITGQWISRELLGEEESLNLYSYCHNDPVNKVDVLGLQEIRFFNEFWVRNGKIGTGFDGGTHDSGPLRTIPHNHSEALAMWNHELDLFRVWCECAKQEMRLAFRDDSFQEKRDLARLSNALLAAQSSIIEQLRIYDVYRDEAGNLTDEMLTDSARIQCLMPQVASVDARGCQDASLLAVPAVRAFAGSEMIFSLAEEEIGTGGAYAASAGAFLIQIRGIRNIPIKLLAKSLENRNRVASGGVIYNVTEDFSKIVSSGRVWGQTEGSVYGMRISNAAWWRTMVDTPVRDAGTITFEGQAATLFKPHPVEGLYSGLKRALGQQKAGFGDIVFNPSTSVVKGNNLIIHSAYLAPHAGQSSSQAAARLWGRRIFIDTPMTAGAGYLLYQNAK